MCIHTYIQMQFYHAIVIYLNWRTPRASFASTCQCQQPDCCCAPSSSSVSQKPDHLLLVTTLDFKSIPQNGASSVFPPVIHWALAASLILLRLWWRGCGASSIQPLADLEDCLWLSGIRFKMASVLLIHTEVADRSWGHYSTVGFWLSFGQTVALLSVYWWACVGSSLVKGRVKHRLIS